MGFSKILFKLSSGMSNLSILFPACRSAPCAGSLSTCEPGRLWEMEPKVADPPVASASPFPDWISIVTEKANLPSNHVCALQPWCPEGVYCVRRIREEVMRMSFKSWLWGSLCCGQKEEGKKLKKKKNKKNTFFHFFLLHWAAIGQIHRRNQVGNSLRDLQTSVWLLFTMQTCKYKLLSVLMAKCKE